MCFSWYVSINAICSFDICAAPFCFDFWVDGIQFVWIGYCFGSFTGLYRISQLFLHESLHLGLVCFVSRFVWLSRCKISSWKCELDQHRLLCLNRNLKKPVCETHQAVSIVDLPIESALLIVVANNCRLTSFKTWDIMSNRIFLFTIFWIIHWGKRKILNKTFFLLLSYVCTFYLILLDIWWPYSSDIIEFSQMLRETERLMQSNNLSSLSSFHSFHGNYNALSFMWWHICAFPQ